MEYTEEGHRIKRFKHQSYNQTLKDVHLPSALSETQFDHEIGDNDSHFHESLEHWRQLNLSPSFLKFAQHASPLSASMPLLLHNWREIVELWVVQLGEADDEGLRALLDLLQKMTHDLRTTLSPVYTKLLGLLLKLLPRAISAPALTALLSSLASLFKHLLVPLTPTHLETQTLSQTWTSIRQVLPKCLPEIQRAFAEVWGGSVLRRLKSGAREEAVGLMAGSVQGIEDAVAWMFVFACKSVSQTMHTATLSILTPLIDYHLTSPSSSPSSSSSNTNTDVTYTLIRRTLTALIHHVKNADQFSVVGEFLVNRFCATVAEPHDPEYLRKVMEIVSIPCSVRHGSRLTPKQISTLSSQFPSLPLTSSSTSQDPLLTTALLKFTVAILMAGHLDIATGRKVIERVWEQKGKEKGKENGNGNGNTGFAVRVSGALAELGWSGWRVVGLGSVLRGTMRVLGVAGDAGGDVREKEKENDKRKVVGLAAALWRDKKLKEGDVDLVWRTRIEGWAIGRLEEWSRRTMEDDETMELSDILTLSSFLSSVTPFLVRIVEKTLAIERPEKSESSSFDEASFANSAWVLGACMQNLAYQNTDWIETESVDLTKWTRTAIEKWGSSEDVLAGLVALSNSCPSTTRTIPLEEVYPSLRDSLFSHSRSLRLNTLHLLSSSKLIASPPDVHEVVKRCLQGEEVALDVQGVRERLLRIGRVGLVVKDGDLLGADLCARWLVAQLKVNLRPLWSPTTTALASLAERFGDVVWRRLFDELKGLYLNAKSTDAMVPSWMDNDTDDQDTGNVNDPWEDERTWRDPSAHKLREVVVKWLDDDHMTAKALQNLQGSRDRLDYQSYEFQLLAALGESSSLAEKHNRDLVPFFLSLAGPDAATKLSRQKLSAWLTLFSKFTNPKALYSTETLHTLYITLLSHPDRAMQLLSLSCLFTYKSPHLVAHESKLRTLLDDTRWRDELTSLDLANIEPQNRGELVDVVIRLLFGLMLEKRGRSRGADRRAAVLSTLAGCTDEELGLLVDLMLKPLHSESGSQRQAGFSLHDLSDRTSEKQQIGFLTLLGDVLKNLGSRLLRYWPALLGSTIDLIAKAQARITAATQDGDEAAKDEELGDDVEEEANDDAEVSSSKVTRSIRQLGLKRFADFFRQPVTFDFKPFMKDSFTYFISPRLLSLDKENTQAPSALLELFFAWTHDGDHVRFLVDYDACTLPKIYDCLIATNVKPAVVSRIFDIVDKLLAFSTVDEVISETVVKPHVSQLLNNLALLVERSKGVATVSTPLGQRQISILSEIAQYSTDATQASTLLTLFSPLLRRPAKIVPEKVKVDLLKILSNLLPLIPDLSDRSTPVYVKTYELLSQLFQTLRSRPARMGLVSAFQCLARLDRLLQPLAELLESLNAYSSKRMDEPDFDRRLTTFATLNEQLYNTLPPHDWLPILYNMLSFIQDPTEMAVRNNASFALRHFVDLVVANADPEYEAIFMRVLLPGLKNGLRSKNEMVRSEILGVIGYAVTKCDRISSLQEMQVLLAAGDEEANFFNNIHHVQIHRRSRALRRLADLCDEGRLRSSTLADIFVPLVGNYITTTASLDHHLVNEAILTTGRMAKHLAWGSYYALVQKYLRLSREKDESERVYVRTLVALLDNFHFPMEEVVVTEAPKTSDDSGDADEHEIEDETSVPPPKSSDAKNVARIADAVNIRLLPNLLNHLEKHDATTEDSTRIPIAIGIVTVAKHLPTATREPQISRLLTVLSQILRSRSQETRDLTRDALARIAVSLGPSYLPLIIRELRGALLRGPQLHVLAYVTHALLVHVTSGEHADAFDKLDECVNDVAYVSAEVVFGESGKDVQAEEFKTKMREVRTSSAKGLDSFNIMAKFITPSKISGLLVPLRSIMQETESVRVTNLVEEVLKRVASGLNANKHLVPGELLVLCHTLISQNSRFLKQAPARRKNQAKGDAIVQIKRQEATVTDHYANNSFRFVAFGLDLFNTALRRNRFDFRDSAIISRLESMVVVVGNTLYSSSTPVLLLGLKSTAALIKCPLKSLTNSLPVFIRQIIDIIKQSGNTESEVVQVGFKSLASILRDGPAAEVKEKDLVYLLELLSPDLEEPARQASVFTMLRAIVSRKFVVPEIYDLMDKVSEIMVTSQSPQVQELCRGVLLQFLLDYPQGKGRLRNQMTFFAKNLSYVYESGRKSVMELLGAVVAKFEVKLIREYADLVFVALVMVVANDDSSKCREMAGQLIKTLFTRLDDEHRKTILSHLHAWATQHTQPQLARVSSQVYGLIIDVLQADTLPYVPAIMDDLRAALERSAQSLESLEDNDAMEVDLDWQVPYHALIVLSKTLRVFPELTTQQDKISWKPIVAHLLFPHAWVRTASCRLLGLLFTAVPVTAPTNDLPEDSPLSRIGMQEVAKKLCQQLKSEHLDEPLSLQVVKNLFYVGKCLYAVPLVARDPVDVEEDGSDDEEETVQKERDPLPWLFSKLSYQVRSAHIARRNRSFSTANWSQQPLAVLRWFAAMASFMDPTRLEQFLVHILAPLYRITEDDTIRDTQMDELKTLAIELQDLVQSKVGTTKFSNTYNQIRQGILGVRRERKAARVMQATTNPQAAAQRKQQKNVIKKDSRKRKSQAFADTKGGSKRRREE